MNLNHLKYFYDAVRLGKISESARVNRVSQSAVSQAIASLERTLERPLLVHQRKRLELTEEGQCTYRECEKVFASLGALHDAISDPMTAYSGALSFASNNSLASSLLPSALSRLQSGYERLQLKLRLGNSQSVRDWVKRQEVELGLAVDHVEDDGLTSVPVFSGRYVLCRSPKTDPSLQRGIVVTRRERPEVKALLRTYQQRQEKALPVRMEVLSWEVIKSMTLTGPWIGLCPDYVVRAELETGKLKEIRAPGWIADYTAAWVHRTHVPLSKRATLFMATFREACAASGLVVK